MIFPNKKDGFTLVEMMVVIAIFLIVTGVILINVPNFREKTTVDLVAQDIAVTIRSSQVFGIGTRALDGNSVAYGVYMSSDPTKNNQFTLFADLPDSHGDPNYMYDPGDVCGQTNSECQSIYSLNGFSINKINAYDGNSVLTNPTDINISFVRPKSSPQLCTNSGEACPEKLSRVEIIVQSLKEKKQKAVAIYANGQIAVQDVAPTSN